MSLELVPRTARALSAQLNAYYRVFKGVDPDSVALRLPSGGSFEVRHSVTAAPVLRVTDAGFDAAIGTSDLADGAVTSAKIADGTIQGVDIANATITSDKLVTGAPITPNSITSTELADGGVQTVDLAANAVSQGVIATGSTANPATSAGSPTPLAEMSVVLTCTGGPVEIDFTGVFYTSPGSGDATVSFWRDGVAQGITRTGSTFNGSSYVNISLRHRQTPPAGAHTFAIYYHVNTGSVIAAATSRSLIVTEAKR